MCKDNEFMSFKEAKKRAKLSKEDIFIQQEEE